MSITEDQDSSLNSILPLRFGNLITVNKISWDEFKGKFDENLRWSAHSIQVSSKFKIDIKVELLQRSWVKQHKKCDHLLNHEQGHFMIANLCALEFLRRIHVHKHKTTDLEHYEQYANSVFQRTLKQYLEMEKAYDEETEHRLNYRKQAQWDARLKERLLYYHKIFDQKKNKFLKLKF